MEYSTLQRDLGRLEGQLAALTTQIGEYTKVNQALLQRMSNLEKKMAYYVGGFSSLVIVLTVFRESILTVFN